jgi:hypothetical protein
MKEQVYAKEVNNRDELLIKINNVADIIHQTPNVLEKTWSSLHHLEVLRHVGYLYSPYGEHTHRHHLLDQTSTVKAFDFDNCTHIPPIPSCGKVHRS